MHSTLAIRMKAIKSGNQDASRFTEAHAAISGLCSTTSELLLLLGALDYSQQALGGTSFQLDGFRETFSQGASAFGQAPRRTRRPRTRALRRTAAAAWLPWILPGLTLQLGAPPPPPNFCPQRNRTRPQQVNIAERGAT